MMTTTIAAAVATS